MSKPLTFIIGVPRSGTTLLATLLEGHSSVYVDDEAVALRLLRFNKLLRTPSTSFGDHSGRARAVAEEIARDQRLERFYQQLPDDENIPVGEAIRTMLDRVAAGRHYVDKSPDALPHAPRLAGLFPASRFLCVVRDPRPTVASLVRRQYLELHEAALLWRDWAARLHGLKQWWPTDKLHVVRYEDLVAEPEKTVRSVCDFLGLPFETAMLALGDSAATAGEGAYVKSTFDVAKLEGWRKQLSARDQTAIEEICFPEMIRYGYVPERATAKQTPGYWALYRYQLAHKIRLAGQPVRKQMIERRLVDRHVPLATRLGAVGKAILRGFLREDLLRGGKQPFL